MGCDIHVSIETLDNWPGSKWYQESTPFIRRDYRLFSKLAGVRNYEGSGIVPIAQPRGMPSDVTPETREYLVMHGDHSPSWISEEEFKQFWPWEPDLEKQTTWTMAGWSVIVRNRGYAKMRIVFNFDN